MYLAGATGEPIDEGMIRYSKDAYINRNDEGYLWSHGLRVCRVGAYRKNEQDTTMYVENMGIEVPAVFLNYSYKMCKEESNKYQKTFILTNKSKYEPYIKWLDKRIKYFQVIGTLEGKPL